jgi:hypothetical protein
MNWYKSALRKLANGDPLINIRMLIGDGIKAQLHSFMHDPAVRQYWTDGSLQNQFVGCDAAFTKALELCQRYRDYKSATDRVNAGHTMLGNIIAELGRRVGKDMRQHRAVAAIMEDVKDVMSELQKLITNNAHSVGVEMPASAARSAPQQYEPRFGVA